jgi:ELWxxDGT repeat protein
MKKITLLFLLFSVLSNSQTTFEPFNWQQFIIYPGNFASKPMFLTEYNGNLYFQARGLGIDVELYKTDGTAVGTTLFADIMTPPNSGSYPENFTVFQNELFFTASHAVHGRELFKTDGTNVTLVKDINPGVSNSQTFTEENQTAMLEHNGFLYFFANDGPSFNNDWDLWKTNGTTAGTTKVLEFNTAEIYGFKKNFKLIDGKFYFMKKVSNNTFLYQFNPATETLIELTNFSGDITYLTEFENKLFFNNSLNALYYTNGILNANNSYVNFVSSIGSRQMKALGLNLIFIGANLDLYRCYWNSTDMEYITTPLYDFSGSIDPFFNQTANGANEIFTEFNNKLYFAAREATSPTNSSGGKLIQIYSTDGLNTQVAVPIDNLDFESYSGNFINKMTLVNDVFYLIMYDFPNFSYHLWRANPINGSYEQISFPNTVTTPKRIAFEHESKPYNFLKWFNNSLYMGAFTTAEEKELWGVSENSNLGSSENNLTNSIMISPNPTSGIINLQAENLSEFTIEIYDLIGKKVGEFKNQNQLDITNHTSGIYILKVIDNQTSDTSTQKIIKQ